MATLGKTSTTTNYAQYISSTFAGLCITETLTTGADVYDAYVYLRRNTSGVTSYCKVMIWDMSGNLITNGVSNEITVDNNDYAWKSATFSTHPQLSPGSSYYLGIVHYGGSATIRAASNDESPYGGTYPYSITYTGANITVGNITNTTRRMTVYVNYNETASGPALKIEGVTPNKVEGVSWSDLNDIY